MITVGVRALKGSMSHYLRRMRQGKKFAITKRGIVIGYLSNMPRAGRKRTAKYRKEGLRCRDVSA